MCLPKEISIMEILELTENKYALHLISKRHKKIVFKCPFTSTANKNIEELGNPIRFNLRLTVRAIAESAGINP